MNTGERIKAARKAAKISQSELGNILGVSQAMISAYEMGIRNPKLETLSKIADALGVLTSYLLDGGIFPPVKPAPELIKELQQEDKELSFLNTMGSLGAQLNDDGQEKAIEQVELLTKIPAYRANIDKSKDFYYKIDNDGNLVEVDKLVENPPNS